MFCSECGKQLNDNAKFCDSCGANLAKSTAPQEAPQPTYAAHTPAPVPQKTKSGKGSLIGGWIMAILGGLSVLGAMTNGTYYNFGTLGMTSDDFIMVIIQIALVVGGIGLIMKGNKAKNKQ